MDGIVDIRSKTFHKFEKIGDGFMDSGYMYVCRALGICANREKIVKQLDTDPENVYLCEIENKENPYNPYYLAKLFYEKPKTFVEIVKNGLIKQFYIEGEPEEKIGIETDEKESVKSFVKRNYENYCKKTEKNVDFEEKYFDKMKIMHSYVKKSKKARAVKRRKQKYAEKYVSKSRLCTLKKCENQKKHIDSVIESIFCSKCDNKIDYEKYNFDFVFEDGEKIYNVTKENVIKEENICMKCYVQGRYYSIDEKKLRSKKYIDYVALCIQNYMIDFEDEIVKRYMEKYETELKELKKK